MLTSLIDITPAAYRRGANQMRQQLSVGEHFWRGNAPLTLIVAPQGPAGESKGCRGKGAEDVK